jgi:FkbM family methyltransferase
MYLLKENSASSTDPYFINLSKTTNDSYLFFPELNLAKWFYESGIAEKNLIMYILNEYVTSDKSIIDIGAHVGTYSFILGKKAHHTYSFECNPKVFCYLAANIALHELEDKITPYRYALGNREGTLDYIIRSEDGGGNGIKKLNDKDNQLKKIKVQVKTLDSFHLTNIGFIKIDVEGFEKEVLEGSLETLKNNNYPPILFECWGDWKEKEGVDTKQLRNELFLILYNIGYIIRTTPEHPDMYIAIYKMTNI